MAELKEGITVGYCRGGCKNKKGGEKPPISQRTQHALY